MVYEVLHAMWGGEIDNPSDWNLMFSTSMREDVMIYGISKEKANKLIEELYKTGCCDIREYDIIVSL